MGFRPDHPQGPLSAETVARLRKQWEEAYRGPSPTGMEPSIKYETLEDEWNAKQDRVSYFWKIVAAIAVGLLLFLLLR